MSNSNDDRGWAAVRMSRGGAVAMTLVAVLLMAGNGFAQPGTTGSVLLEAAEIFENLTEGASNTDEAGFKRAMASFDALRPVLEKNVSAERKNALESAVGGVRDAWRKGDRGGLASQSIEAYRVLQESIDRRGQRVPVEVSLLDYVGFKTRALLLSAAPDWGQAVKTAGEASGWWAAIRPRVKDATLQAAMDHAVAGLKDGAARKDRGVLVFAAELDLILVDGLEEFFVAH